MISLKPIFLWKYLGFKRNKLPENIRRLFYLSWEDALWDILSKKQVKKGSIVLVPEFFCGDVEENIRKHGYEIAYFPVSKQLKTTELELLESIKKYNPAVLIIFHAVGITNNLLTNPKWLKKTNKDFILIEDCVHRIIDRSRIKFLKKNHFIIDSLRKVVPLQGSAVYGNKEDIHFSEPPVFQSFFYSLKVTFLWMMMNIFWTLTQIFSHTKLAVLFADQANQIMKSGYDLIGDSVLPARGFFLFKFLLDFIDPEKIKAAKKKQVEFYIENSAKISKNIFQEVEIEENDKGELIGYPLILSLNQVDSILAKIRNQGLRLNFELNDNQWSKKHKIIYLPLGLHLSVKNLNKVIRVLTN